MYLDKGASVVFGPLLEFIHLDTGAHDLKRINHEDDLLKEILFATLLIVLVNKLIKALFVAGRNNIPCFGVAGMIIVY